MTENLLPCPFCGRKAKIIRKGTARQLMKIGCTGQFCGAFVESGDVAGLTKPERWSWNTRAKPQSVEVGEFKPELYNKELDRLEFQTVDAAVVSDRIDEWFSVLREVRTNEIVGFQLWSPVDYAKHLSQAKQQGGDDE